jgi:2-polyprenyl-3-methyl-5-hydroxy-6-metoxy-1,4-benzoquinol methylase
MGSDALKQLYEDPATPRALGAEPARYQAEVLAARIAGLTGVRRVLDVGCGDGATGETIRSRVQRNGTPPTIIGIDWSQVAVAEAAGRGFKVARGSADNGQLPVRGESVEVVVVSEMIEHVVDTDGLLAEARRVLVPGGVLVLSTPNLAAWYNRVLLALGIQPVFSEVSLRGIYGRPGHEVVGHLRLFTRRALTEMLVASGFDDVTIEGAPYHDVPRPFRPLDRLLCKVPDMASILVASARRPGPSS